MVVDDLEGRKFQMLAQREDRGQSLDFHFSRYPVVLEVLALFRNKKYTVLL